MMSYTTLTGGRRCWGRTTWRCTARTTRRCSNSCCRQSATTPQRRIDLIGNGNDLNGNGNDLIGTATHQPDFGVIFQIGSLDAARGEWHKRAMVANLPTA